MKIFIPVIGTKLKLKKEIAVTIKNGSQNRIFLKTIEGILKIKLALKNNDSIEILLPKNLVIKVDRVYIRKGPGSEFNSLTFTTEGDGKNIPKGRFFIPVEEANKIEADLIFDELKKKEKLIKSIERKIMNASYRNRPMFFDLIEDEAKKMKKISEGSIFIDIKSEINKYLEFLDGYIKDNGFESISDLKNDIELAYKKEKNGDEFNKIKNSIDFIKDNVNNFGKCKIFTFKVFKDDNEIILQLTSNKFNKHEAKDFNIIPIIENIIACIAYSLNNNEKSKRYENPRSISIDSVFSNIIDRFNNQDEFSEIKINGIKKVFNSKVYSDNKNESCFIFEEYFSKIFMLNTQKYKNYALEFQDEDGEAIDMRALRRYWKNK